MIRYDKTTFNKGDGTVLHLKNLQTHPPIESALTPHSHSRIPLPPSPQLPCPPPQDPSSRSPTSHTHHFSTHQLPLFFNTRQAIISSHLISSHLLRAKHLVCLFSGYPCTLGLAPGPQKGIGILGRLGQGSLIWIAKLGWDCRILIWFGLVIRSFGGIFPCGFLSFLVGLEISRGVCLSCEVATWVLKLVRRSLLGAGWGFGSAMRWAVGGFLLRS
jgi:hypothetical protein